ncbi:hypothetical protein B0H99_10765 [Planomicrobium soli]|uniref:Uncharacterized protein n=1 Tax=Planomicrobium soli TaxID=1176648 RepID=A0A2P8GQL5_9BACL|nr:hypothetical protein [Planomicrobium soli]PSL36244.1 hypothetical protein B0H99_10765 [Planomicrobium soli]
MKKAWMVSSCAAVLILVLGLGVSAGCFSAGFIAILVCFWAAAGFTFMLILILVLRKSRVRMDRGTVVIGLRLFLLFLSLSAFPLITVLVVWLASIKSDSRESRR